MAATETDGIPNLPDFGGNVDMPTFSQILEMDESEEDRDFSKPLVVNFFEQAEETFDTMDAELEAKNLKALYELGHFLKGSSATLGFNKIRDSCQIIQQFGKHLTLDNQPEEDDEVCLAKIEEAIKTVKVDFDELKSHLVDFFGAEDE